MSAAASTVRTMRRIVFFFMISEQVLRVIYRFSAASTALK